MFYEPEVTQRPLVREIVRFKLVVLSQLQVQTRFRVEGLGFIGFTLQTRELFSASKDLIEKIRGLLGPHKKGPFGPHRKERGPNATRKCFTACSVPTVGYVKYSLSPRPVRAQEP